MSVETIEVEEVGKKVRKREKCYWEMGNSYYFFII